MQAAYINLISYFCPLGNTSAACLTQNSPPGQNASLLLLGCGDVRNTLFTAYMNSGQDDRVLDITCCDIEPAIIARNVLLLALLVDDVGTWSNMQAWNVYYHFYLDDESLALLSSQSQKLLSRIGMVLRTVDTSDSAIRRRSRWSGRSGLHTQ